MILLELEDLEVMYILSRLNSELAILVFSETANALTLQEDKLLHQVLSPLAQKLREAV